MARLKVEDKEKTIRSSRLEARVNSEQKMLFERAATLQGCSLSNFIIASAREAAIKTIQEYEIIKLVGPDRDVFVKALLNPPKPTKKMREAALRYKKDMDQ
ncbi:MAG: type II toxin-antitoxin system TacA family antitoxin [Nitrospiria bacterium]